MDNLLAKSNGQKLTTHLVAVGKMCYEICKELEIGKGYEGYGEKTDAQKQLLAFSALSGLLHDIGKIDPSFQNRIKQNKQKHWDDDKEEQKKDFNGPYHNELGLLLFDSLFNEPINNNKSLITKTEGHPNTINMGYLLYHHHPVNFNHKDTKFFFNETRLIQQQFLKNNSDIRFDDILKTTRELTKIVFERFNYAIKLTDKDFNLFEEECTGIDFKYFIKASPKDIRKHVPSYSFEEESYIKELDVGDEALKKLLLSILIESDIIISNLSEEEAVNYIDNKLGRDIVPRVPSKKWGDLGCNSSDNRTQKQIELANKISKKQVSVVGCDTGAGKTTLALLSTTTDKTNILLPKIFQVESLGKSITKDALRLYGKELKVIKIHSETDNDIESDNYNVRIMVFDKGLSHIFSRRDHHIGLSSLFTDLVIDEFHEFSMISGMIIPLKILIQMRMLTNRKTILLSGTPDIGLVNILFCNKWDEDNSDELRFTNPRIEIFKRDQLPALSKNPSDDFRKVSVRLENSNAETYITENQKDSLVTLTSVLGSQMASLFIPDAKDFQLCHSKYTSDDKRKIIEGIMDRYEENGEGGRSVISPKMLSSSFDISFRKIYNEITIPSIDCQMIGRCNRHQTMNDAEFVFCKPEKTSRYISQALKLKKTHDNWIKYLEEKFLSKQQNLTHRDVCGDLYDGFFTDPDHPEYLTDYENEVKDLATEEYLPIAKKWFPKKGESGLIKNKKNNTKSVSKRDQGFRGNSFLVSLKRVNESTLQDEEQLRGVDCIGLSESYLVESLRSSIEQIKTKTEVRKFFTEINEYKKSFGRNSNSPYIMSFISPEKRSLLDSELEGKNIIEIFKYLTNGDIDKKLRETITCDDTKEGNLKKYKVYTNEHGVVPFILLIMAKFTNDKKDYKELDSILRKEDDSSID